MWQYYSAANRLTGWTTAGGTTSPTYDANCNQIGDGTPPFTWDARDRLTAITGTTASFGYDGAGRRTSATVSGTTTGYLYDSADVVQEQSGGALSAGLLTTTLGGKLGCLTGFLAGFAVFGASMFLAFYGDCFDSEQCHRGEGLRFLAVILLTLAAAIPVGLVTRKLVNGWTRDRS